VEEKFNEGYTFCVLSSDVFLLWEWARKMKTVTKG